MEPKRRREVILAALVIVLGAGLYVAIAGWPFGTSTTTPAASNGQGRKEKNDRAARAGAV